MPTTPEVLAQSLIAFVVLFILARVMGKRQVAQLTMFDYIVGITIGNIAAAWSLDDVRSIHAVCALLVWSILPLLLAIVQRKSYRARIWLDGRPSIVIHRGRVLDKNLRKARLDLEELLLLLRKKDIFKLSDVEYAVFEVDGSLTVMKKSEVQPVTPKDMGIPIEPEHESRVLIIDGKVMTRSLEDLGYTKEWLLGEVMKQGAQSFKDVFVAQIDSTGTLYVDLFDDQLIIPQVPARPLLAASLKKIQADLETFALQTDNPQAKRMFADSAEQLKSLLGRVGPFLK
ncbi:MAG: DUF421 domain-containing protein [Alicyclobacillus sp.]|nr:DUF421 domain-containing protein [Alicyclobacillus sp.]